MKEKRNQNKPQVIVIVGPTASGKSNLGILLARKFNGEIISADSRQVYKGMDIGTGKVPKDKNQRLYLSHDRSINTTFKNRTNKYFSEGIRHYLLDIASPKQNFTVDRYKKLGEKAIQTILNKNKIPIIVGGTGFYIDALVRNLNLPEVPPNKKLRKELEKKTVEELFAKLKKLDPTRAKTIDSHNKRRLIRALEIISAIGTPIPVLNTKYEKLNSKYSLLWLGVKWPQKKLAERIKLRLDSRLEDGMIKEVQKLIKSGAGYHRLFNFGLEYRQISLWLKITKPKLQTPKEFKKTEYYQKLLREIIKYSKRQMTWFKRNKEINWVSNQTEANSLAKRFLLS